METKKIWSGAASAAMASVVSLGFLTGASATTLGDVSITPMVIFDGPRLNVRSADDGFGNSVFDARDLGLLSSVFLDFDDVTEGSVESSNLFDLDVVDLITLDFAVGEALDFEFDYAADTLSILYELGTNDFSSDAFGVAVLYFLSDISQTTSFLDLDGEQVEFDLFGATASSTNMVPLPASLPLVLAGLSCMVWLGRRNRS